MASYLLAHDLGTSGNKATLYSTDGALIKSVTYSYGLHVENGICAEQDPLDWWRAVCESTKALTAEVEASKIAAVSFSGQMMGCVCVDRDGNPLRPAMIWADMRSTEQERQIRERIEQPEFYRITGHRISSSYSATKLMWVRDHEPDVYRKTAKMLNAKDFIILKLTGKMVTEPSDASSTCLLDLNTQAWSDEIIEICGLSKEKLPDILRSVDIAGTVTPEAATACGLLAGTPVVCGGGDGVCAAVGTGAVKEGRANCCLGTSSWISYASKLPVYDENLTTFNFAHIVPGYVMPCGTMQCGGGSLSWAVDQLCKFDRVLTREEKGDLYTSVCKSVEESPVGAKGLLFLPYLIGERSPRWNEKAKGSFVGLTLEHTTGDMLRAVMEGVAMNLHLILNAFQKQGASIERLTLIGGGARNAVWRQILADVLGVTVETPNQLEEATSMGAAITAGVGVGAFADFDVIGKFLKTENTYTPDPITAPIYKKTEKAFDQCYFALEKTFELLYNM
ncbi:MAG: xylulokinase [Clostridia bacterium]|nr:xylulokinase [Clostridia bacterium]